MLLLPLCFPRMCTSHPLLYGFGFMLDSSILASLQSTILAYLVRPPCPPLPEGCVCQKGVSLKFGVQVARSNPYPGVPEGGGGGGARPLGDQPQRSTASTAPTGTAPQRSQRPLLIGVSASRFGRRDPGSGGICLAYTASLRENWAPMEVWVNNAYHGRTRQPKYSQYGEFFRDIEEYAHASVLCETRWVELVVPLKFAFAWGESYFLPILFVSVTIPNL
ncbi:hypothetical protein BDP67DRAFT_63286 [Colletotrichum lupini]|nr:hypothetical protein BDP67DRAFT_63286 [Colletotrichum lupini]